MLGICDANKDVFSFKKQTPWKSSFFVAYDPLYSMATTVEHPIKDPLDNLPTKDTLAVVHFNLQERDNLPTEDKVADLKVSFIQRFHCIANFHSYTGTH